MKTKLHIAIAAGVCVLPSLAVAEITFNGFASVGAGIGTGDIGEDTDGDGSVFAPRGVDDNFSSSVYNKFGLQVSGEIDERISFTGQLLAKGEDDYNVEAEWLYVTYSINSENKLRFGKIRAPFFYYSDFLDVGYAYPWISPPHETYRVVFTTVDGIDYINDHNFGNVSGSFQAYFGKNEGELAGSRFEVNDLFGANYTLTWEWLTLRASYNEGEISSETPLPIGLNEDGAAFWGVGGTIDNGNIFIASEYTATAMDRQSFLSDDEAYYFTYGMRFGDFMPHITYSYVENDPEYGNPIINAVITENEDESLTVGLRWDAFSSAAVKFEIADVSEKRSNSNGATVRDDSGTLISFSIDTVF